MKSSIEQLNQLTEEFDKFTYIVSHDLSAPMRRIRQFSAILLEELESRINDEDKRLLDIINRNVDELQSMLDALLLYSRIKPSTTTSVDCHQIITAIAKNYPETELVFTDLPVLTCNEDHITTVFRELIDNAVKFNQNDKKRVVIEATPLDNQWQFTIADNGMGLPENAHEKVFEIFRGLHHKEKFNGMGMGLAYTKKIVELNGGTIDISSTSEEGTQITFSWPSDSSELHQQCA